MPGALAMGALWHAHAPTSSYCSALTLARAHARAPPTPPQWHLATFSATAINLAFSCVCILLFGVPKGSIILNLPEHSVVATTIKVLLCVVMILTYTLFLLPIAEMTEPMWPSRDSFPRRALVRTLLVLCTAGIAAGVPQFSIVTNLVGGVFNITVCVILPPLMHLNLCHKADARAGWAAGGNKYDAALLAEMAGDVRGRRQRHATASTIVADVGVAVAGFCIACFAVFATVMSVIHDPDA